jgi:Coenzyme PQQ synthesis protein D (PqqD)
MPMFPKRRVDVTTRDVNGETLILDRKHEEVHQLNSTASYVWQRCDGKTSIAEIALSMAHDFCAEPADVERDVAGLIAQFSVLHLLESE